MTETLQHNGFMLSEIANLKEEIIPLRNSDTFSLLISDANDYSPPEVSSVTLQDRLQEISNLNEVHLEDSGGITPISGIEASDVCSLYEQFLEYEQASDAEPLSYPESSIMSPNDSPGQKNKDLVLDRLMCVQKKLTREVAGDGESVSVDVTCHDTLVMNIPNDDKLLRTVNGIHPKGNLLRMADSPKFAKLKKKRLTNDPPLRIASSLPNTPRCTSPSDQISSEERKHMEIKLIEALALPVPKQNPKQNPKSKDVKNIKDKNCKDGKVNKDVKVNKDKTIKDDKSNKDNNNKKTSCPTKRKQPAEPIPSRLLPVVSKRQRNNIDKTMKDPRLKEHNGCTVDPRLNRPDYCSKSNVTILKSTNLFEINASTNSATETVDDVCIIDMLIDQENLPETVMVTSNMTIDHEIPLQNGIVTTEDHTINHEIRSDTINSIKDEFEDIVGNPESVIVKLEKEIDSPTGIKVETMDESSELKIVEFPSISAVEIKTEETEELTNNERLNGEINYITNGLIKPEKNYRKAPSVLNGSISSASDNECDDDDRAYNRKKSSKKGNTLPKTYMIKKSPSKTKSNKSRSCSVSKTPSANNSRPSSRHQSKSPPKESRRKRRSLSPEHPLMRSSSRRSSESSASYSDRSDGEDISNKLIELSNPVPYDIEHERKLRFLSGGAAKGMGERRNIYAGGITEDTSKPALAERFRRFGKISKITLHFRDKGDNYAFIVFEDPDNAMRAIEEGNDDPSYPHLDLCFGGRRKFVGGSYVDFDGNNRFLEETDKAAINNRCETEEDDFDRLLQLAMKDKGKESKKRETTPEWS